MIGQSPSATLLALIVSRKKPINTLFFQCHSRAGKQIYEAVKIVVAVLTAL